MKGNGRWVITTVLILAALYLVVSAQSRTITGRVISIADGDTITVLDSSYQQIKVRFNGIDTPESEHEFRSR